MPPWLGTGAGGRGALARAHAASGQSVEAFAEMYGLDVRDVRRFAGQERLILPNEKRWRCLRNRPPLSNAALANQGNTPVIVALPRMNSL